MRRRLTVLLGALALLTATPSAAQEGSEGSRAFVESVFAAYAGYGEGVNWPLDERRLDQVWTPRMAALIRRDRGRAPSGAADLDTDPLCQCQRWEALRIEGMSGGLQNDLRRILRVAFINGGERGETYIQLEGNPNQGWRIADVLRPDGYSLGEALEAGNPDVEAAGATRQTGPESAEAFVRAVYASYSNDVDATPPMAGNSPDIWSERMSALIVRDQQLADGDLPYLDADPICNCQDWESLTVQTVEILPASDGRGGSFVRVSFTNAGSKETVLLRLSGNPEQGWRIDDVVNEHGYPALAEALAESNRLREAGLPALGRD